MRTGEQRDANALRACLGLWLCLGLTSQELAGVLGGNQDRSHRRLRVIALALKDTLQDIHRRLGDLHRLLGHVRLQLARPRSDQLHRLRRAIVADKDHLVKAPGPLGSGHRPQNRVVVDAEHHVKLWIRTQHVLKDRHGLVPHRATILLRHDLHASHTLKLRLEAVDPIHTHHRRLRKVQNRDLCVPAQLIFDVLAGKLTCHAPTLKVVGADEGHDITTPRRAIHRHHRDARLVRRLDGGNDPLRVHGTDDHRIHLLLDEILDLRGLSRDVDLCVLDQELKAIRVRFFLPSRLHVLVKLVRTGEQRDADLFRLRFWSRRFFLLNRFCRFYRLCRLWRACAHYQKHHQQNRNEPICCLTHRFYSSR